jgi:hypothetical protein
MELTNKIKELLIGIAIFLLILLLMFVSYKLYTSKTSKLEQQVIQLQGDLIESQTKRAIESEAFDIEHKQNIRSAQIIDSLIKHKPIIKPKQNAPINYNTPPTIVDSIYKRNFDRFK